MMRTHAPQCQAYTIQEDRTEQSTQSSDTDSKEDDETSDAMPCLADMDGNSSVPVKMGIAGYKLFFVFFDSSWTEKNNVFTGSMMDREIPHPQTIELLI